MDADLNLNDNLCLENINFELNIEEFFSFKIGARDWVNLSTPIRPLSDGSHMASDRTQMVH